MLRLMIGNNEFTVGLIQGSSFFTKSPVTKSLDYDTASFVIQFSFDKNDELLDADGESILDADAQVLVAPSNQFQELITHRGDEVCLFDDNLQIFKMYLAKPAERKGHWAYLISAVSAMGLWASQYHYGGMYAPSEDDTVASVVAEILDATEIVNEVLFDADGETLVDANGEDLEGYREASPDRPKEYITNEGIIYTMLQDVASLPAGGHLPIDTKRNNLLKVLFPYGISVFNSAEGIIQFGWDVPENPRKILAKDVYESDPIISPGDVTKVTVIEHAFFEVEDTESEVLYDTSKSATTADHTPVEFAEPVYGLQAIAAEGSSFVINESNCNYAVVTGNGILIGKKYTHTTQIYAAATGLEGAEKEERFDNQEMITVLNSSNTLKRLVNYYGNARRVNYSFVHTNEVVGEYVTLSTAYDGDINAFIESCENVYSRTTKTNGTFIANWIPKYLGNNYSTEQLFTEDGTFVVPEGITQVYVTLASGGQGGQGGHGGYNSHGVSTSSNPIIDGGLGGEPGEGGSPGRFYSVEIAVEPGDVIEVHIGEGGEGGEGGNAEQPGSLGESGEDTTITVNGETVYSSASGAVLANPFIDILSGEQYGFVGDIGDYSGAKGGNSEKNGEDLEAYGILYKGGKVYNPHDNDQSWPPGGGAAAGQNGGDGYGTTSGRGANATIPGSDSTQLSSGAQGGSGGGGGGGPTYYTDSAFIPYWIASNGVGGKGSKGGKGAPGFALFFY